MCRFSTFLLNACHFDVCQCGSSPLSTVGQTTQVALENLKSSSDLDARTASQFTPLHWAATLGHLQVALLLIEHGVPCLIRIIIFIPTWCR